MMMVTIFAGWSMFDMMNNIMMTIFAEKSMMNNIMIQ